MMGYTHYHNEYFPWIPEDVETYFTKCTFEDTSKDCAHAKLKEVVFDKCNFKAKQICFYVTKDTTFHDCNFEVKYSYVYMEGDFGNVSNIISLCRHFNNVDIRKVDLPFDHANVLFKYLTQHCLLGKIKFWKDIGREAPSMSLRRRGMVSYQMPKLLIPHFMTYFVPTIKDEQKWDSYEHKTGALNSEKEALLQLTYERKY